MEVRIYNETSLIHRFVRSYSSDLIHLNFTPVYYAFLKKSYPLVFTCIFS